MLFQEHSKQISVMDSATAKKIARGCSCIAGGPNNKSCKNKQFMEGVSFHKFPNKTLYPERFERWVHFVRRHRKDWQPSKSSTLCSIHFPDACYNMNRDVARSLGLNPKLNEDAFPTIDVANV